MAGAMRKVLRLLLPLRVRRGLVRATRWPPVGTVELGDLARTEPVSRSWGGDRGTPVDRYYIESFLRSWQADIRGRVLEIGDNEYTLRFGGGRVTASEVLDAAQGNPKATYVDDLTTGITLPDGAFDCIVCTQTLQVIPDVHAAMMTLHRILRPGGVLLATVPRISPMYRDAQGRWQDFWGFTDRSAAWLAERVFEGGEVRVETRGNVLSATAFLQGLAAEELAPEQLELVDPDYQVSVGLRAVRSA
jgi:SAM-dependent methyltransferase